MLTFTGLQQKFYYVLAIILGFIVEMKQLLNKISKKWIVLFWDDRKVKVIEIADMVKISKNACTIFQMNIWVWKNYLRDGCRVL